MKNRVQINPNIDKQSIFGKSPLIILSQSLEFKRDNLFATDDLF